MAMVYWSKKEQEFLVSGKKHAGKTLEDVAKEDPGYLAWLWTSKEPPLLGELTEEAYEALDSIMREYDIPQDEDEIREWRKTR